MSIWYFNNENSENRTFLESSSLYIPTIGFEHLSLFEQIHASLQVAASEDSQLLKYSIVVVEISWYIKVNKILIYLRNKINA